MAHIVHHFKPLQLPGNPKRKTALLINPPVYDTQYWAEWSQRVLPVGRWVTWLVPLPRVHLVRSGGCLAPHSTLRATIVPTARQQGADGEEASNRSPRWRWPRLLKRVFALDLETCPVCQQETPRLIAAIIHGQVIRQTLRHLRRCADPSPNAPARACPDTYTWASP